MTLPADEAEPATPQDHGRWVLLSVSTAGGPGSLRVHVWRKLRSLGALYLHSSVCLLPATPAVTRDVRRLVDRVKHEGGSARVLAVTLTNVDEERALRAELNTARDGEYGELLERVPAFLEELASERAKGRTTYAEVEESEADLDRFRGWLAKIEARDYFRAPRGELARAAVARRQQELVAFEAEALALEAAPTPSPSPELRAVPVPEDPRSREAR